MNELAALFEGWNTPMVRACLQGTMGQVDVWSGRSALASIGDFCFLGGKPVPELVAHSGPLRRGLAGADRGGSGGAGCCLHPVCHLAQARTL